MSPRLALVFIMTLALGAPASAQYFGQNKVQYKTFDFQILKTEHFDIYYYPAEREGADIAARLAERWYARLSRLLEHDLNGRQPLVLYGSHPDFEQTNVIQGEIDEGTGGVTEPLKRRIVLPLGGPLADTDHVIGHELVHAFQFDLTTRAGMAPGENGAERLPLWFIEGMAEYLSLGPVDSNTAMWLRDAVGREKLPAIRDLDRAEYFPYRWGHAFWAYVGGRWGDSVIGEMLIVAAAGGVDTATEKVLALTAKELSADWQASIRHTYEPVLATTTALGDAARLIIKATEIGGRLNVGPAISPDGRWIAFLSERSFFSAELYLADATTGKIVRTLTKTASDPHFSSIQFIYSAGAWDAASRRLAIATVTGGHPALAIFTVASGRLERELAIRGIDEIFNPTWAPDGDAICFAGMTRGLTDLYVYDLKTSSLRRLTDDPYADVQPAWSPDGRRIAFATDRFTTTLDTLAIGAYRLALIDPATGAVEAAPVPIGGASSNPQWSPDGAALYFISTYNGIPNLYRVALATAEVAQITNVPTGLSGITGTSPTMSIAAQRGVAAFSVYESGKYDIYMMDVAGRGAPPGQATMTPAAALPPIERKSNEVSTALGDATSGLPPAAPFEPKPYSPALSLQGFGQPFIAMGVDRFGAAFGGGVSLYFGDMLGNHQLATAVQFNSGLGGSFSAKDTAAQVGYFNQAHRLNWGVVAGQMPYLSGGFQSGVGLTPTGEPVAIDQTIFYRQTERSAAAIVAYPFDRARRFEVTGGLTQLSFDQIVQTTGYSLRTGQLLINTTDETSLARTLTLATSSAAFVSDTSNYGATSPARGERFRVEAAPTFGTIDFTSVLADYRRYVMPLPFYTVAARVMHFGRYGGGAEDSRLYPLYLGYPTLVRGYDVNSFGMSECVPTAASQCPAFDRLLGSRLLVGNLELRFPLLRPFGVSRRMYGPLPVEVALFADAGVAWKSGERPALLGGTRDGVASGGVALRVGFGGYAVGEFDFARPFQRPGQGWVFQFNLTPGF
jgi:Tol biopolymer transport system component